MRNVKDKIGIPVKKRPSARRSVAETISATEKLAKNSASLVARHLTVPAPPSEIIIPRYLYIGPKGGSEPIRVGLFASAFGDEPEGTHALLNFIELLEQAPETAEGYCLFLYPILNPTGFELNQRETGGGVNITTEIWKNSISPEVQVIQSELWMHGFDGLVSFKVDARAEVVTVAIGGQVFARHFLGQSLADAQDLLPQSIKAGADALPKFRSASLDSPNDLIRAAPGLKPRPFEIVITLPRQAPLYMQQASTNLILERALSEYRKFIAYGANL